MKPFRDVTKGPGDLPGDSANPNSPDYDPTADEAREEAIDALLSDANWRAAHEREAEQWTAGTFEGEHYTEVTLALDALHREGATAAVIERLHRLARVESMALSEKLREVAENEVDSRRRAA